MRDKSIHMNANAEEGMTDRKEKTLKTMESFEKHKQPDPESVLEEELRSSTSRKQPVHNAASEGLSVCRASLFRNFADRAIEPFSALRFEGGQNC